MGLSVADRARALEKTADKLEAYAKSILRLGDEPLDLMMVDSKGNRRVQFFNQITALDLTNDAKAFRKDALKIRNLNR